MPGDVLTFVEAGAMGWPRQCVTSSPGRSSILIWLPSGKDGSSVVVGAATKNGILQTHGNLRFCST